MTSQTYKWRHNYSESLLSDPLELPLELSDPDEELDDEEELLDEVSDLLLLLRFCWGDFPEDDLLLLRDSGGGDLRLSLRKKFWKS